MKAYSKTEGDFLATHYVVVMFLLVIGSAFVFMTYKDGGPYGLLRIDSRTAVGTVVQFEILPRSKSLSYRFVDADGIGREGSRRFDPDLPVNLKEGDSVAVHYFPLMPGIAEPEPLIRYLRTSFIIMLMGGIGALCAALYSVFIIVRWSRRRSEARHY